MLSASKPIISHDKITDVMDKLGYKSVKTGVCNGLSQMWVQAVLCGETDVFIKRLHFICQEPNLLTMIKIAQSKRGLYLTKQDQRCIDVLAFFDGVQLYQNFREYTHLLAAQVSHLDAATLSSLTLPIKLNDATLVEIYSENRLFDFTSFHKYLHRLSKELALYYKDRIALQAIGHQAPELAICLHTCTHKVVLMLNVADPQNLKWQLADANQYVPFELLCKYVYSSVRILRSLGEGLIAPVNISIYTTLNNLLAPTLQTSLLRLKNSHSIHKSEASTKSSQGTHLLKLTAMRGDTAKFLDTANHLDNSQLKEFMLPAIKVALLNGQPNIICIASTSYPNYLSEPGNIQDHLSLAILTRQNNLIKIFMSYSASLSATDKKNKLPLHLAIKTNNLEAVKELTLLGANINQVNEKNETPLMVAIRLHHIAIVNYLAGIKNINFDLLNNMGEPALIVAAKTPSIRACEILLDHQANINITNRYRETAVHAACLMNDLECLRLLAQRGANLATFDKISRSPIFISVLKQYWKLAAYLLLQLRSLNSFNPNSLYMTQINLQIIVDNIIELTKSISNQEKLETWLDIKNHRNAIGMILEKKPGDELFRFFPLKEKHRKKYLHQLRSAIKPSSESETYSKHGYARV